jgi:hypothetical protein
LTQAQDLHRQGERAFTEWQATHSQESLDAAIRAFRSAFALPWSRTEEQVQCLADLIKALSAGAQTGSDSYTNEVIDLVSQALSVAGNDPFLLGTRGYNLMLRYTRHGSLEDLNTAVVDFKKALAATPPGDVEIYRRVLNVAWASEARFDRLRAHGEQYMVIQQHGVERWRGPRDLVHPISLLETLLGPDNTLPPAPPGVLPQLKRNLANLLSRYALYVQQRSLSSRRADMGRSVSLLQEAMTETPPDSFDHVTAAQSLVATVQQGRAAGLLPHN